MAVQQHTNFYQKVINFLEFIVSAIKSLDCNKQKNEDFKSRVLGNLETLLDDMYRCQLPVFIEEELYDSLRSCTEIVNFISPHRRTKIQRF